MNLVGLNAIIVGFLLLFVLRLPLDAPGETGKGVLTDCALWYQEGTLNATHERSCRDLSMRALVSMTACPTLIFIGAILVIRGYWKSSGPSHEQEER